MVRQLRVAWFPVAYQNFCSSNQSLYCKSGSIPAGLHSPQRFHSLSAAGIASTVNSESGKKFENEDSYRHAQIPELGQRERTRYGINFALGVATFGALRPAYEVD